MTGKPDDSISSSNLFEIAKFYGLTFQGRRGPSSKHVVINGFRIHYLDWGNNGKPPMLLLHGGGQTAHAWDLFALCLRDEYHIYALDLRGHGDSEWSPVTDYSEEANIRDLQGFIENYKLSKAILVGFSSGGGLAFAYAARYPDKVAALVIVDIGPELNEVRRRGSNLIASLGEVDSVDDFVNRIMDNFPVRRPRAVLRRTLAHNLRQLPNGKWTLKTDRRFRMGWQGSNPETPPEATKRKWGYIRSIQCPTLIVRGEHSPALLQDVATRMGELIPGSRVVNISNAGHTLVGSNPPEFEERVREFLRTLPS